MKNTSREFRLDLTMCFGQSLFEGQGLTAMEQLLQVEAPQWVSDLHIWREGENKPRRDIEAFAADIQKVATERGQLFADLISKHGSGTSPRRAGSVELRGADDSLVVFLELDEYQFAPSAGRWLWGNTLSMQFLKSQAAGDDAVKLAQRIAAHGCADLSPWYARGHLLEEWERKNVSHEGGGVMALGLDASRYLPGLYWLNFLGEPYCSLIGKERLLNAPAHKVEQVDAGFLLYLASTPSAWETPDYNATEARVLRHLGSKYFFNRWEPDRETTAPDFGLQPLPRNPRFT